MTWEVTLKTLNMNGIPKLAHQRNYPFKSYTFNYSKLKFWIKFLFLKRNLIGIIKITWKSVINKLNLKIL